MKRLFKLVTFVLMLMMMASLFSGCKGAVKAVESVGKSVTKNTKSVAKKNVMDVAEFAYDAYSNSNSSPKNVGVNSQNPSGNMRKAGVAAAVGGAATAAAIVANANAPTDEHWIKDNSTDIYLWNPQPEEGETVNWNGGYVQDGAYKYADGSGTVVWRKNGRVTQTDECTFVKGQRNGRAKHTFASGNVAYSNWDHGKEIQNNGGVYVGTYNSGLQAYMLPNTLTVSNDKQSIEVTVEAVDNGKVITHVNYRIWRNGNSLNFSNSQGYNGVVQPSMTVENNLWKMAHDR